MGTNTFYRRTNPAYPCHKRNNYKLGCMGQSSRDLKLLTLDSKNYQNKP